MELFRITSDLDHPLIAFDQVFKKIILVYGVFLLVCDIPCYILWQRTMPVTV